jgi:hypothetical protein
MTTIQKIMKLVQEQEKKQKVKKQEEEQKKGTIENLQLYIPYAFDNVSKEMMREKLNGLGKINVIDFVAKQDKKDINYNSAYVYFDCWYPTPENKKIQAQIKDYTKSQNKLQSFKFNYDGTLHWVLLENTSPSAHPKQERKVMIDLNEATLHHDRTKVGLNEATLHHDRTKVGLKTPGVPAPPTTPAPPRPPAPRPEQIMSQLLPLTTTRSTNKKIVSIDEVIESQKAHPQGIQLDRLFQADLERKYALVETMRLQEEQEQQAQQEEQAQQAHQEYIQEVYNYYYMMECDEMDQITEAIDEEVFDEADAWAEYLEQIEEECDFCEDNGVTTQETKETFTSVDYSYVKMLECELAKVMSYSN